MSGRHRKDERPIDPPAPQDAIGAEPDVLEAEALAQD